MICSQYLPSNCTWFRLEKKSAECSLKVRVDFTRSRSQCNNSEIWHDAWLLHFSSSDRLSVDPCRTFRSRLRYKPCVVASWVILTYSADSSKHSHQRNGWVRRRWCRLPRRVRFWPTVKWERLTTHISDKSNQKETSPGAANCLRAHEAMPQGTGNWTILVEFWQNGQKLIKPV